MRRTSEMRQHQHAGIVRALRRNEFLGNQIHTIAQRCHETDTRASEEPGERLAREAAIDVADRRPVELGEFAIDAAGSFLNLAPQGAVLRDLGPRMRRDLQIVELTTVLGPIRQKRIDRVEAMRDAFAVIEPIDAENERPPAQAFVEAPRLVRIRCSPRQLDKALRVDADRKGGGTRTSPESCEHALAKIDAATKLFDAAHEGTDAFLGLEAHQIVIAQRLDQCFASGKRHQNFGRREGRAEKKADAAGDPELAQFLAEREEMVVMHPDEVVRRDQRRQHLGEAAIDVEIGPRRVAPIIDQAETKMQQRP